MLVYQRVRHFKTEYFVGAIHLVINCTHRPISVTSVTSRFLLVKSPFWLLKTSLKEQIPSWETGLEPPLPRPLQHRINTFVRWRRQRKARIYARAIICYIYNIYIYNICIYYIYIYIYIYVYVYMCNIYMIIIFGCYFIWVDNYYLCIAVASNIHPTGPLL